MNYRIKLQAFTLKANQLISNGQIIEVSDKTMAALQLFLSQPQAVISKDDFMQTVWGEVIVSDASLFKQIQVTRCLLQQVGLPDDIIENVYGKGYRLKYPVKQIAAEHNSDYKPTKVTKLFNIKTLGLTFVVLMVLSGWVYFFLVADDQRQVDHQLTDSKKQTIVELSKSDWQMGLDHITNLLADDKISYSNLDLGFLYQQKGQAQLELQQYPDSAQSLQKALAYFQQTGQQKVLGATHTLISRAYGGLGDDSQQTQHVQKAVDILTDSEDTAQVVDALMELAYLHKKSGDFERAVSTYSQAANRAKQGEDQVGQMMAINNLAATYLVMNNTERAQQLLQQGLDLSLEIGEGRYIASAYSMMSQIYLQKNQPQKAIQQLQEALRYQLKSNSSRGLNPKLMTLNYLLVETFQTQQASDLLQLTQTYVQGLNQVSPMAIVQLYQGMNLAHQQQWQAATTVLQSAWQSSQVNNFSYQEPLLLAYFALCHARSEQPIQAIEAAQKVLASEQAEKQEKTMAKVALAWAYYLLENPTQYQQTLADIDKTGVDDWLFVAQQYWQLKLLTTAKSALSYDGYQSQLNQVLSAKQDLREASKIDEAVLQAVRTRIQTLIVEFDKVQSEKLTQSD